MKRLIIACSLVLTSSLFANEAIPSKLPSVEVELSENKEVDRLFTNFGTVRVGSFSYVNYYITNTGNQPLYFRNARIAGPGFYARHNCGGVLPQRGRCTFTIEYSPYFEGWSSGQFMMSFDPGYTVIVDLQGQAVRY